MTRCRVTAAIGLALVFLASAGAAGVLTGSARELLRAARDDARVNVIIVMAEGTDAALTASPPRAVGSRLRALADRSQRHLRAELSNYQARGEVIRVTRLTIINGVAVTATKRAILEISRRPDIRYVCADPVCRIPPIVPVVAPSGVQTNGVDWNISAVRADAAWADFGLRGEGMVIGNIDTGADVSHPALAANYRGGTNSWFDAIDGSPSPHDIHGHGTATTSGACGNDPASSFYGVAPNARFMIAKGFDDDGNTNASDLLECAAWMLDPDGDPATADMPDVVNNSWGAGREDLWFLAAIQAWDAAGIYPVFAAGNDGPDPGTIASPADYLNVVGVGATNSGNLVATWSSRGPATWNGTDYLKPNLVAPGSGVRVARTGGGYHPSVGGTSFACPHVAGAAALVFQKQPALSHSDLMMLLENTAADLGPEGPDYDYGHGLLDVCAALAGVPNLRPELAFVGTPGYETDGVEPDEADALTDVTWKIKYSDPDNDPPSGPVKVHISRKNVPIPGSPFDMVHEGASDFLEGEVYSYTRRLPRGSDYAYHFEASDGNSPARGEGTVDQYGPVVRNSPPVLTWLPTDGFVTDGADPDVGDPWFTQFRFGVRYADPDGDPPATIGMRIERTGTIIRILELRMHQSSPDYVRGVRFTGHARLSAGRYRYRFFARDGQTKAVGEGGEWQIGPAVRCPPRLDWTGGVGYETDGCEPETGAPVSTVFEFRVKVSDTEGKAPDYVKLLLRRNGVLWKELETFPRPGGSNRAGRVYKRRARLPIGRYAYRFLAEDGDGMGVGPATHWQRWLFVRPSASGTTALTVTASPAGSGVEIAIALSSPGALTCRVLNLAGRPVRTICLDRDCPAGIDRLPWDLRATTGLAVPGGTYLVQAVVRSPSGAECRALSAVSVRRR